MNYFDYLKKNFPFYVISGIVLGVALMMLIIVHRYNEQDKAVIGELNRINVNKMKVKKEIVDVDNLKGYFLNEYNMDISDVQPEALMMGALDRIKTEIKGSSVSVGAMSGKRGKRELDVEIRTSVDSYEMIVGYVDYVQSFTLPDFRIDNLSVIQEESGSVVMKIKGVLVMPSLGAGLSAQERYYG